MLSQDPSTLPDVLDDALVLAEAAGDPEAGVRLRNELADSRSELLGILVNGVKSSAGGYLKGNLKATHEYQAKEG